MKSRKRTSGRDLVARLSSYLLLFLAAQTGFGQKTSFQSQSKVVIVPAMVRDVDEHVIYGCMPRILSSGTMVSNSQGNWMTQVMLDPFLWSWRSKRGGGRHVNSEGGSGYGIVLLIRNIMNNFSFLPFHRDATHKGGCCCSDV
jgi:hypothetical protein